MKKKLLALTLVFALLLAGCSASGGDNGPPALSDSGTKPTKLAAPVYPDAPGFDDYEGKWAVREAYPVEDAVWDSLDDFAARSASLALGGTRENALYSPLSLWFALAICAESAAGDTRAALLDVLGLENGTAEAAKGVYNQLYTDNKIGALKLASSLWINKEFPVKQDFLDLAAESFYAHSYTCDFGTTKTGKAMGEWLSDATGGLLGGGTLETSPETLMTLFSSIYFSDQWMDEFQKDKNTTGDFHNADGSISEAEYLNRTYGSHGWYAGENWVASGLSLKNHGSMYFVLPDEGVTPGELLADGDTLAAILNTAESDGCGEVVFQIPKFEVSGSLDLKDTIAGLGAGMVFDADSADFSNLSDEALCLSAVKQEATLSIDEKGVTAAAFTQIDYAGSAMPEGRAELILDRPFLFFVRSGGTVLFIGVVNEM